MKKSSRRVILFLLLGSSVGARWALAQKPAPQQQVTVVVVNAMPQPPQPVKSVSVSVMSQNVTAARGVTNSQGQALLQISSVSAQAGDLHLVITGAGDLLIYQPAGGELPGIAATIPVSLLPKGSLLLIDGPGQIEAMLHRESLEIASLQKQVASQQPGASVQSQKPDLGAAIAEWALAHGFSAAEVDQQAQQWAEGIQEHADSATPEQKALAELALKHYDTAAQLFNQAGDADKQQLSAEDKQEQAAAAQAKALQAYDQALLDKARASLLQLLDHAQQAAGADQLNLKYHQATQTLEGAENTAQDEYKKHPDDKGFHELWLRALRASANARESEGEVSPANQSLPFLAQSVADDELLAHEYGASGDRAATATARNDLGVALTEEGLRAGNKDSPALFDRAIQEFQSALNLQTKADLPLLWATTQRNLADALKDEGERVTGDKAAALLNQAVESYRNALEVYDKSETPRDWAITQNNLGNALHEEGERAGGNNVLALLNQSVEAFQSALEIYSKGNDPRLRAGTEANLGNVLIEEGSRTSGEKGIAQIDQAIQAYRSALQVFTRADLPQEWARTQAGLGSALFAQGRRASADKAGALFDQAAQAFRSALEVRTRADLPQDWAQTQSDLGAVLFMQGEGASGDQAISLFNQAVQAYRSALEVRTKANLPQQWAMTQSNLGLVLSDEAQYAAGDAAVALFDQAAQAFSNSLEIFTRTGLPQSWAAAQQNLGLALESEAAHATGDKATALFGRAIEAFQHALEVRTKTNLPQDWAATEVGLGNTLMTEGEITGGEKAAPLLNEAIQDYEDALEIYTKAGSPSLWVLTEMNLTEAEFTAGQSDSCLQQVKAVADTDLPRPEILAKRVFELACAWSGRDKSEALAADKALLSDSPVPSAGDWDFTGVNRFVSNSPAFAPGRASWIALFTAVQNGDGAGMTAALKQLEPILQQ